MGRRVVLRERLSQPQSLTGVDWGNPVSRALLRAWNFNELADADGRRATLATNPGKTANQVGKGLVLSSSSPSWYQFDHAYASQLTSAATILYVGTFSDVTDDGSLFGLNEPAGAWNAINLGVQWTTHRATFNTRLGGTAFSLVGTSALTGGRPKVIVATYDGATTRLWVNGNLEASASRTGSITFDSVNRTVLNRGNSVSRSTGVANLGAVWNRALTPAEIVSLSANPWQLFAPQSQVINIAATVSVYRPGSDVTVNGWTSTPSGTLASCIDDPTLDRADFITSPDLSSPATLAWNSPLPAGNWSVSVDGVRVGTAGQVRVVCLDAGGTSVGNTSWQVLTGTDTTYTLPVTTTATSTQFRIEVQ